MSIETGKATRHEGFDQGLGRWVEEHNFYIDDDLAHKKFQRFVSSKLDKAGVFDFTVERSAPKP